MTFNTATASANGDGTYTVVLNLTMTEDGDPFLDRDSLDQERYYAVRYFPATNQWLESCRLRTVTPGLVSGDYIVTQDDCEFTADPTDWQVYGYIAQNALVQHEGGTGAEIPAGSHVHLYDDVVNAGLAFGLADTYVSAANVGSLEPGSEQPGCTSCHGDPYLKHGQRAAKVEGLADFAACKVCHVDDRSGGHEDWQYMVDQPLNWATAGLPAMEVEDLYAYTANVMNDTHMSHAMEFPYPMSMSNCTTCHEGKLSPGVLDNTNFTATTCKSCHAVQGTDAWPELGDQEEGKYYQSHRAPPLDYLFAAANVENLVPHQTLQDPMPADCTACHGAGTAPPFDAYHTGYDVRVADSDGNRYADTYTASIGNITLTGDSLRIEYGTSDATMGAEVLVSFYGWDSKDFLVASHERDGSELCTGRGGDPDGCRFEYESGDTNPLFTEDPASAPGAWIVTADLAAFQAVKTDPIPALIASGQVDKAEITVTPTLTIDGVRVGLNAVTQTFDLGTGANVDNYFKGDNAIVSIDKCNVCHDQLAVTFHSGSGRGGDIVACRNCHNPTFTGSHLEMTSRATENYVHSIHTFQAFDTDDVFAEFDPVFSARYNQHIRHVFPNFTIRNCEACHVDDPVTYNVPDQSKSMPGVLSESYEVLTWYQMVDSGGTCSTTTTQACTDDMDCPAMETCVGNIPGDIAMEDPAGRTLGNRVEMVTGPASRACGACHRSRFINQDQGGALASFDAHTQAFGTYVPNDEEDEVLYGVIDKIMSIFE
jgi:OmcA/MtrC family decaheme c-type cytochrome